MLEICKHCGRPIEQIKNVYGSGGFWAHLPSRTDPDGLVWCEPKKHGVMAEPKEN